jgi:hypothetical protein
LSFPGLTTVTIATTHPERLTLAVDGRALSLPSVAGTVRLVINP